ncbi:MAG: hypothetical protein SOY32_02615 [Candidatus Faecousia sp.]|nr:hypothetical protein [Bacillota bacterium]MDY4219298.1 hypothetical protein [Candidatus Faecousia sp.]
MEQKKENPFVGYEYKEVAVPGEQASMYLDCYENFGWEPDGSMAPVRGPGPVRLRLKRDRKIMNKMELTRLQRHFEACAREIDQLERSKTSAATAWALGTGVLGTAFMAGSVFAVTAQPPVYWLCILLAIPAFAGWIAPWFLYRRIAQARARKLQPMIEAKQDELYEVCEKGHALL